MEKPTCQTDGCEHAARARGYCNRCLHRIRKYGTSEPRIPVKKDCSILDCDRPASIYGYCERHGQNWKNYGSAEPRKEWPMIAKLVDVGWTVTNRGCWEWRGFKNDNGYGLISTGPRDGAMHRRVHRVMWEMHNGPIDEGAVIRHRCDNPPCVNPNHLELGDHAKNMRDMSDRGRSRAYASGRYDGVCAKGLHDVTLPDSLRVINRSGRPSETICVQCDRDRKARHQKKKAAA